MTFNFQDHYFHLAKKENYLARAVYKLQEIQNKHKVIRAGDRVLDLGAAPGSWMQLTSRIVGPSGLVVGIDLKKIEFRQSGKTVEWDEAYTSLLELADDNDVDIDSGCQEGYCGTCKVKMISGEVEMKTTEGLDDADVEESVILPCVSVPITDLVIDA